ncbi:MAG: sugar ABC transporter ATP-binding protein [Trueperaceae bacterium]
MSLLQMTGVDKRFGQVAALTGVDFSLEAGEVHALVGENGAGKSTLMKILAGVQPPDAGSMTLAGRPVRFHGVDEAQAHGVVMVYQELALVPSLSVAENLFLGRLPRVVGYRDLYARARGPLAQVELDLDPAGEVANLGIGERQLLEIARALAREGRILVLDEPTAALSASESERLFAIIEKVKASGVGMVYISHRLEEVFRIADRVTVLRDGRLVGTRVVADTTPEEIVQLMVGKSVRRYQRSPRETGEALGTFEAAGPGLEPLSIALEAGEVVGLAGVIGSGRERILPTLFGLEGTASWAGDPVRSPRDAIREGILLVPSDRKAQGLVMELTVQENVSLATLSRLQRFGFMDARREREQTRTWIERLSLRPPEPRKPVRELSGGNQQKVVVAKSLATEPKVLLLDEPTRGVDVGARAELYDVIDGLSQRGLGLLLSSSDTEELIGLSDRILVFRGGRVATELRPPFDYEEVVAHVTGARQLA